MNDRPCSIRRSTADDYPTIVAIEHSLGIVWPERRPTPEAWAEADRNRNPNDKHQLWVAVIGGDVVGLASYGHSDFFDRPHWFYVNVEVSPNHQRQGIGAALYGRIMAELEPLHPRVLRADAFTNLPQGFPFLQKRGFYEAWRETPVHLDVVSFDPHPYAGLEADLACKGIVIRTVQELESDPDRDRKTYDLYWEVSEGVPHEGTQIERQPFGEWVKWGLHDPTLLHDATYIAVRGDEYVGLGEWGQDSGGNVLQGGLLGVRRACRRQGISLAMTVRAIAYARAHACPVLKTCTAVQNAPMQALFNKLGFARDPEWIQCQKDMPNQALPIADRS